MFNNFSLSQRARVVLEAVLGLASSGLLGTLVSSTELEHDHRNGDGVQ